LNHFKLIAEGIDPGPVLRELEANPDLWNEHRRRKEAPGTPHSEMSDIWVRYNDDAPYVASGDWSGFNDAHVPVWYPASEKLPSLMPVIFALMGDMGGEMLGGVLITKIPPGCKIDPHVDRGWHVEYYDKYYFQLQNAPGCVFGADHGGVVEELEPKPGEIWLFDNRKLHWVRNDSQQDRITVIICIRSAFMPRGPLGE
jgi:hypothetical protein